MVKLQSSDGVVFDVEVATAKMSATIKDVLEIPGVGESPDEVVPLPVVHSTILAKVIEWATHHRDDHPLASVHQADDDEKMAGLMAPPAVPAVQNVGLSPWDTDFLNNMDIDTLFKIIHVADYLGIPGLLEMGCEKVSWTLRGKTPQKVRELFDIESDFTPAEEERNHAENAWCMRPSRQL
ncbi:hypothetical protein HPB48_014787 [Haemaphysalis longicornis]|uniref:Skp1-related protein n=1 Tax=Haemaphysalis longicornis TaxID=44386 RepID=A0A9J6GGG7_HAELO|nr:hypothetical protein HPB48_014787 [Haemaphysalis longicornis]